MKHKKSRHIPTTLHLCIDEASTFCTEKEGLQSSVLAMALTVFRDSTIARYARTIRQSPREVIFNRPMLLSVAIYALTAMCISKCNGVTTAEPLRLTLY